MTASPTPALRNAIADAIKPHIGHFTAVDSFALMFDIEKALAPFLAPAPVEQAAQQAAKEIAQTLSGCSFFDDADDGVAYIERVALGAFQRHFQSLATENKDSEKWAEFGERVLRGVKEASASGMMSEEDEATLECAMQCGVGNVQRVPYDPDIHGNDIEDAEPGDPIWWWSAARASTGKGQT